MLSGLSGGAYGNVSGGYGVWASHFSQSLLHPPGEKWEGTTYKTEIVDVCGPDEEPIKANTIKVATSATNTHTHTHTHTYTHTHTCMYAALRSSTRTEAFGASKNRILSTTLSKKLSKKSKVR